MANQQSGVGILAFITNHSYLNNATFRGMRQQLMDTFTDIYVLDLHGNARHGSTHRTEAWTKTLRHPTRRRHRHLRQAKRD